MKFFCDDSVSLFHGDCLEVLAGLPDGSVDSVVTDPPYGLAFMGNKWDTFSAVEFQAWCGLWAAECLRVLKPGGHLLAFGGTRTFHRLAVAVEDAGFEIRDSIAWLHSQGFPKGGNLKPAFEPVVVGRKGLAGKSVVANVLEFGVGRLNIDAGRVAADMSEFFSATGKPRSGMGHARGFAMGEGYGGENANPPSALGRWPANVILDESQAAALDLQSGFSKSSGVINRWKDGAKPFGGGAGHEYTSVRGVADEGGASRFFYVAKANKKERPDVGGVTHPTVKPLALMQYLVRLVTPVGGVVLEPFAGSGATVEAAILEGFDVIAVEREESYLPLIVERVKRAKGLMVEPV